MSLFNIVSDLFEPVSKLIDEMHTSEEEKLSAKHVMMKVQTAFLAQAFTFEQERLKARSQIITAEAKSGNWLTASWRPVTMYCFLVMLLSYWWGLVDLPATVTPEVLAEIFELFKIGIGGYIGSRGIEKVAPAVINAFKKRENT